MSDPIARLLSDLDYARRQDPVGFDMQYRGRPQGEMRPIGDVAFLGAQLAEEAERNPAIMFSPVGGVARSVGLAASGQPVGLLEYADMALDTAGPIGKVAAAGVAPLAMMAARGGDLAATRRAMGPMGKELGATVYHGSPHRFDKFDLSKIGTGEGAQKYGHGLYFADSRDVARSYQSC